ncbi:MAG: hypothetical protein ACHWZW_12485 [Spirulina sp.]
MPRHHAARLGNHQGSLVDPLTQGTGLLTSPTASKYRHNWENIRHPTPMTQDEPLKLIDQAAAEAVD